MSPAKQAAWPEQLFSRWHSGISAPLCHRCCSSCLPPGVGREGGKQEGGFVPGLPQGRTQWEVDILGEEKVKRQAGSGESWEAVASCQTPRRSQPALASHSQNTCSCSLSMGEQWWGTRSRAMHRITGKLPECQESLGRERKPQRDARKAAAPPSAPFSVHTSLHYLTLLPYRHPSLPACQPCSKGWLAASAHRKAVSQLICTGREMWRTGEGKGHL